MERVSHFWLMKELSVGMWGTNLSGNPVSKMEREE